MSNTQLVEHLKAEEEKRRDYLDLAFKILAALVIPLILWGVKLEVNNAVLKEKVAVCARDIHDRTSDLRQIQLTVNANLAKLSALNAQISSANTQLTSLRMLLLQMSKSK